MLIKITNDMTNSERIAAENTNNQYLQNEYGTAEIDGVTWEYEKHGNGTVYCWTTATATYINAKILDVQLIPPITFTKAPFIWGSLQAGENQDTEYDRIVKHEYMSSKKVRIFVYDPSGNFKEDTTETVNILVIGRWK